MSLAALGAALALVREGLVCFPCRNDKRPATPHGFKDATRDLDGLRALWVRHPGSLIGVRTGSASGIDVLDLDAKHPEAGEWWARNRYRFPVTRTHRTRSGGLHLFFQHAQGQRCTGSKVALGIDTRGEGGYVIWWPAMGLPVLSDVPSAPWPQWLLAELRPPAQTPAPRIKVPDQNSLAGLVRLVVGASRGERNETTFWAACRAGEMVKSGLLHPDTAAAVLAEAAMRAGLPRSEAIRTAMSGIRTGCAQHA